MSDLENHYPFIILLPHKIHKTTAPAPGPSTPGMENTHAGAARPFAVSGIRERHGPSAISTGRDGRETAPTGSWTESGL